MGHEIDVRIPPSTTVCNDTCGYLFCILLFRNFVINGVINGLPQKVDSSQIQDKEHK